MKWIPFKLNTIINACASVSSELLSFREVEIPLKNGNPVAFILIIRQLVWMSQSDLQIKTNQEHSASNEAINF